ncbi:hypothetical protein CRV08_05235 [Halarcobacter ebronensis]|uniref:YlxR domain-containing protein n=1 Tax=Halarcobacter ebronensis TaxID=1462615 RepID=A0A4Q0YEH7_9BACT|nr:DUF448 domain-containing protein [Halarcobacter ebronensis]QKF80937.1 putative RNA-binding protein (DUF448 domain) [Halarcobacter ebronensis]RXJ68842.1 hypothetical protein CRV08_05235 [Halarcobacter ebronensis]RXK06255.1 hypothetical protein CRV07_06030 [Halarcobacter ebronensis]
MTILKSPIRTCVICRGKFPQNELLRLKCEDKKLVPFDNNGRSFYICSDCLSIFENSQNNQKDLKRFEKTLCRLCKNKDDYLGQLKEIITHVR